MAIDILHYESGDGVAIVTLDRPEARNALNQSLRDAIADAFERAGREPAVRCVILTGAGEHAFCAGVDLKELGAIGLSGAINGDRDPVHSIESCPKPVIAAVNGVAITGGFELALACDIIIAAQEARFADTHVRVGVIPGWGLSQRLSRTIGIYRAKELALSGNYLTADQAERWGLVNRVVPRAALMDTARRLADDIASAPGDMTSAYKRVIDEGFALPFGAAMDHEKSVSAQQAASLSAQDLTARRASVVSRGREQNCG